LAAISPSSVVIAILFHPISDVDFVYRAGHFFTYFPSICFSTA